MIKSVRRNCYCPNTVPNTVTKGVRYNSFSYPLFTVTCLKLAHGPKKKENKNTNWRNKRTELINCDWTVWTVIVVCELFWTVLIEFSVVFFTWVDCWMCPKNLQPKKPAVFGSFSAQELFCSLTSTSSDLRPHEWVRTSSLNSSSRLVLYSISC